ncbi:hypothetical protein ASC76_19125 [Rhizobacter sp. Root404]|nr:hypothetical protein ASC76_19125 [Rhizobacter sp. Root404]
MAASIDGLVKFCRDWTQCEDVRMCLSDPLVNFRKTLVTATYKCGIPDEHREHLDVDYKAGRGDKPELYTVALRHIHDAYPVLQLPTLEADDVMGIMATAEPGKYIICSSDKDMRSVPGPIFNFHAKHYSKGVEEISLEEANYNFYRQVLTGDPVDSYHGIPGCGPAKANNLLGPVGQASEAVMWAAIARAYKAYFSLKLVAAEDSDKFAMDYALTQARLARILRCTDYDVADDTLTLWTPPA